MAKHWLRRLDEATRKAHMQQRDALASEFPKGSRVEFRWNHRQRNPSTGVAVVTDEDRAMLLKLRNIQLQNGQEFYAQLLNRTIAALAAGVK